jgi:dGTPase
MSCVNSSAQVNRGTEPSDRPIAEGYCPNDESRWAPETAKSTTRTEFERDRARLIHSSALRRLGAKTQVQMAGSDDFVRTRLTHTLEVAQIGRQMAELLGTDPDIVDCACLAHDLGHPPFGHNGEAELAKLAQGIGGFEGNAQTFRILTRLEPKIFFPDGRPAGVNLTRACLDAAVKYPWTLENAPHPQGHQSTKFCVYPDDVDAFRWLRSGASVPASAVGHTPIECQIMDLADDIAYSVHDVEDAVVIGAFNPVSITDPAIVEDIISSTRTWYGDQWDADLLEDAFSRLRRDNLFLIRFTGTRSSLAALKNLTSTLIGRFCSAVEHATKAKYGSGPLTRYSANLVIPPETSYEICALKGICAHFVMQPDEGLPLHTRERKVISDLVGVLMEHSPRPSALLSAEFLEDWDQASNEAGRLRVAIDQVASLTDSSAMKLHRAVFGNRDQYSDEREDRNR